MKDAIVQEHLESVVGPYVDAYHRSHRHDLEARERTMTLMQLCMSVYLRGMIDGAEARENQLCVDDAPPAPH